MEYFEVRGKHRDEVQSKECSYGFGCNTNVKAEGQFKVVNQFVAVEAQHQAAVYNLTQTNAMQQQQMQQQLYSM